MHDLYIPFNVKDEVKKLGHKIKFNGETKLWQFDGDLPADLQKYQLKKVAIPYDVKDHFKKKYSMTWDKIDKVWMCSSEDYDKIVSEF